MAPICLITGGSGFVGGRLIERLIAQGWQVRALARSDEAMRTVEERGAQAARGSLDDMASLAIATRGCSVVVHVAALFKLWGNHDEFERSNVLGTANLLRAAEAASVKRFVQVGAAAVVMGDLVPMLQADLTPKFRTMTLMRFPVNLTGWRSQHETTIHRRTDYQGHQGA